MSSKQADSFDAFFAEEMDSFYHLNVGEQPSSQKVLQEMLEDAEKQKPVQNLFLEDAREADNMHVLLDVCLEDAGEGEDHTT